MGSAIKEKSFRIAAAFLNHTNLFTSKKMAMNMGRADLRKEGSAYDLTLALRVLAAFRTNRTLKPNRKVSSSIAYLEEPKQIKAAHFCKAIQYRSLDREGWFG